MLISLEDVDIIRFFFFQAEDGIRYLVRSRGLGDVYKRQHNDPSIIRSKLCFDHYQTIGMTATRANHAEVYINCLLYTSDAADERSSVDLGGRRIIKKKKAADRGGI